MRMPEATLLWAAQQGQWLQALGYTVYRLGDAPEPAPVQATSAPRAVEPAMDTHPVRTATVPAPEPQRSAAPPVRSTPDTQASAPARAAGGMRRPALPDRLQLAMLRVSGLDPSDPATQALIERWPMAELRGNGAAKRAFWPTLRALRKAARR